MYDNGYAIIIGAGGDLPMTQSDAESIASLLKSNICGYQETHVQVIVGQDASKQGIVDAIKGLHKKIITNPNATILFYFSGHGKKLIFNEAIDYYLLPWGYDLDNLSDTAISGLELAKLFKLFGSANKTCLIFDCCHAAGISNASIDIESSPLPFDQKFQIKNSGGKVIVASSRADEVSNTQGGVSVFTQALLDSFTYIRKLSGDGFIRVLDIFTYVSRVVPDKTTGLQNPILYTVDLQDNFAIGYSLLEHKKLDKVSEAQKKSWDHILQNNKKNLWLIEQRMSEFVVSTDIPLQYIREKNIKQQVIKELEEKIQAMEQ